MELVNRMFGYSACVGIDHEPPLIIRPGLQTSLNRFTQSNIRWAQNVDLVLLPYIIILIDVQSILVAAEAGFFMTQRQDRQDNEIWGSGEHTYGGSWPQVPECSTLDWGIRIKGIGSIVWAGIRGQLPRPVAEGIHLEARHIN